MEMLIGALVLLAVAGLFLCILASVAAFLFDLLRQAVEATGCWSNRFADLGRFALRWGPLFSLAVVVVGAGLLVATIPQPVRPSVEPLPEAGRVGQPIWWVDELRPFSDGLAAARRGVHWGFVDRNNRIAVPFEFSEVRDFHQGMAPVRSQKCWGFVNGHGERVVPVRYRAVRPFSEGVAAVRGNDLWEYIDLHGRTVIPPSFTLAGSFVDGRARVAFPQWYISEIDREGQRLKHLWSVPPAINFD